MLSLGSSIRMVRFRERARLEQSAQRCRSGFREEEGTERVELADVGVGGSCLDTMHRRKDSRVGREVSGSKRLRGGPSGRNALYGQEEQVRLTSADAEQARRAIQRTPSGWEYRGHAQ